MKVGIIGASGVELAQMQAVMKKMGHEAVAITDDELKESEEAKRKVMVMCGHPLTNVGITPFPFALEVRAPIEDNSFRGGSVGKGGKIKYRRG